MSFWGELRRRNVVRVAVAYAIVGWILIQIADTFFPALRLPEWTVTFVAALLILGFPVALLLSWAYELTPQGMVRTENVTLSESSTKVANRKLDLSIIALLLFALGFVAIDQYVLEEQEAEVFVQEAPLGVEPATDNSASREQEGRRDVLPHSVAVLPLENMSPNPDNAYFAAGMHEEILNQLAKLRNLNVISRTTMMQYADQRKPLPEIARELNVETVMEGSVRYANGRILVTVQLIDPETDAHLWADSYPGDLSDVFAIQADIAMNVANALEAEFSPQEQARIEQVPTDSPEAYALFLRAFEANDWNVGRELLQRAIAVDPEFALAYAMLAVNQAFLLINTDLFSAMPPDQRAELETLSRQNALQAIEIDPNARNAYTALGVLAWTSWRWTEADDAFARTIETTPNNVGAWGPYGFLLSYLGRHEEAIALGERALELSPDNPNAGFYGYQLAYAGDYAAATDVLERAIAASPANVLDRVWLAYMEIASGNPEAATTQLEFSERLADSNRLATLLPAWTYGYGRAGRAQDAERIFREIQQAADDGALHGAGGWAMAYLGIGDQERALEWLEVGAEKAANHERDEGFYQLMNLKMNVTNDPLLEQPEFVAVLNRIRGD